MEDIIERRVGEKKLGFGAEVKGKTDRRPGDLLKDVQTEDLLKYGLIPEFLGRLPLTATLEELYEPALMKILTEPKNALVKQYQRLFEMEKIKLEFASNAIEAIAEDAVNKKSGARGLKSIIENVMLDIMYDIPSRDNVREVLIDADVIRKKKPPVVVYDNEEKKADSA